MASDSKNTPLVRVHDSIPSIVIDLKYATADNFVQQKVYDFNECYLLKEVVEKLEQVQTDLAKRGLGLKIWDGYRPISAQERFWQILPDERYVAHPQKGGRHTRGTAVDVTLIDLHTKKELEMPTAFDDFSEKAHIDSKDATLIALENRDLLIATMEAHGLVVWTHEWWHFDLQGWENYPVLETRL